MMKKFILYMGKCFIAAVISIAILSLLSMVYFNPPVAVEQPDGSTNYKFIPNSNWSYMLEGYGNGKTDNMGYNNTYYEDCSNPDVVFAGSSHLEATQVSHDANCVYLINEMFANDGLTNNNFKCLNIGISGHFFETTASNYQYIAQKFNGAKYIVIELFNAEYSPEVLDKIIQDEFHAPMEEKSFIHTSLRAIPFVRLMAKKLNETITAQDSSATMDAESISSVDKQAEIDVYIEKMNIILAEIAEISAENGIVPIIFMHERFWVNTEFEIIMETDETYKNAFKECCENNNIKVIDVSSDMVNEYKENSRYSYGFSNSAPGEGHLNSNGHLIVAEAVYKCINEMEAKK